MPTYTRLFALTAVLAITNASAGCDRNGGEPDPGQEILPGVELSLAEAIAIGEAEAPEGVPVEAELEGINSDPVYEVGVPGAEVVRELLIDPVTGELRNTLEELEDLDEAQAAAAALETSVVTLREAVELAEAEMGAVAVEAEAYSDGIIEIVLLSDDTAIEVEVSMADGSLTEAD